MEDKKLKITLVKSTIGAVPKNRAINGTPQDRKDRNTS